MLDLLQDLADRLNASETGRAFARAFDTTIQFRWAETPADPADMDWFGGSDGSWARIELTDGEATVVEGDERANRDWRFCPLVETDAETLAGVLRGDIRPLDAFLRDRLHISHFTVGGTSGQWVIALLAYAQRLSGGGGILPSRETKSFMTHPYHRHVEERRGELLRKIGSAASV